MIALDKISKLPPTVNDAYGFMRMHVVENIMIDVQNLTFFFVIEHKILPL